MEINLGVHEKPAAYIYRWINAYYKITGLKIVGRQYHIVIENPVPVHGTCRAAEIACTIRNDGSIGIVDHRFNAFLAVWCRGCGKLVKLEKAVKSCHDPENFRCGLCKRLYEGTR